MKVTTLLACMLPFYSIAFSQSEQPITIGTSITFHSEVLDEERTVLFHRTASDSDSTGTYPTIYVLDGHDHFRYLVGMLHRMGGDFIPKMNVVAVTQNDRRKDLDPRQYKDFFTYLNEEVIPMSDSICGQASERILIGHSAAGAFTLNVFINNHNIFNHYLVIDPYIVGQDISIVSAINDSSSHWEKSIFITIARTFPDSLTFKEMKSDTTKRTVMAREIVTLTELLQNKAKADNFTYLYFDKESHMSVPNISMYHGIRFFFEGYKPEE